MKRILLFGLLGGLLTTGGGCGLMQAIFCYRPCVTRGDCPPGYGYYNGTCGEECCDECGPSCGPSCGPIFGPRRAWACSDCGDCDPCCDPCADPCGECCPGRCWHRGPLSCLFALLMRGTWQGPSCGERYWGDFYSDPPDCWDPCGCHGNYIGSPGGCGCRDGDRQFDQYSGEYMDYGMSEGQERIVSEGERAASPDSPTPTPAPRPQKAVKQQ